MTVKDYDSKEKVYEFLRGHAVAVLSTVSVDGTPSAAPIYFVADKQLNFYFITKSDTKKSQNIADNNINVAITVVDSQVPLTVQATGVAIEMLDPEMFLKIAEKNAEQKAGFHWPPPLHKIRSDGTLLMYKFEPTWLRVADFSEATDGKKHVFHQIIP